MEGSSWRRLLRARLRRERAGEEGEAGELNLVPYLDIVVNTVVFLLATTASALPMANIEVLAPKQVPPSEVSDGPVEAALQLTVAVGYRGFTVAGVGGVMKNAEGELPTIRCRELAGSGRCAARWEGQGWRDGYDYAGLEALARRIKARYPGERAVTLTADAGVPYQVVVHALDTLRGRAGGACRLEDGCLFDRVALAAGLQ